MSRSIDWLARQARDPYVLKRNALGYVSRSAFKLEEMDSGRLSFLKERTKIVDLGCAPGGWIQVCQKRCPVGVKIVGVDLLPVKIDYVKTRVMGVEIDAARAMKTTIVGDFMEIETRKAIVDELDGELADCVLSDMAGNSTGDPDRDHLLSMNLVEMALAFCDQVLDYNRGVFLCKVLQGVHDQEFAGEMKLRFREFKRLKPKASRPESREIYYFGRNRPEQ